MTAEEASQTTADIQTVKELVDWRNANAKAIQASPERAEIDSIFKTRLDQLKKAA